MSANFHHLIALALLAIASAPSFAALTAFPQDIFARPAFHVDLSQGKAGPDAAPLPIRNSTALAILHQQSLRDTLSSSYADSLSLEVTESHRKKPDGGDGQDGEAALSWILHRHSPTDVRLCAIPDFTASSHAQASSLPNQLATADGNRSISAQASRRELIERGLKLLEPLKQQCLFHSFDWFTYSFCHGRDIRQFRALTPQSAAEAAMRKSGGGPEGQKAAVEAAREVTKTKTPIADPSQDAFTLGRWKPINDEVVVSESSSTTSASSHSRTLPGDRDSVAPALSTPLGRGTELVEVVQFGDWDEEELHAAESQVLSKLSTSESEPDAGSSSRQVTSSNRQRYLSQTWSDGTLCDINNQPRTIEVQFHCSPKKTAGDRILTIKETTICNYVLIIETSRLCNEPAFSGGKEDKLHQIKCHRVVSDDWQGVAYHDNPATHSGTSNTDSPAVAGLLDQAHSTDSNDKESGLTKDDSMSSTTPSTTEQNADESATEHPAHVGSGATFEAEADHNGELPDEADEVQHTFGDLSQYNSAHDDFYDEALGGLGVGYEYDEVDEDENPLPDYEQGEGAELDTLMYVGIDENGEIVVDLVNDDELAKDDKEAAERSSSQRAKANAVAEKVAKQLQEKLNAMRDKGLDEDGGEAYKDIIKALMADPLNQPTVDQQQQQQQQQQHPVNFPRGGRMEKVGDSLSERARRFYEAEERKKSEKEPDDLKKHVEL